MIIDIILSWTSTLVFILFVAAFFTKKRFPLLSFILIRFFGLLILLSVTISFFALLERVIHIEGDIDYIFSALVATLLLEPVAWVIWLGVEAYLSHKKRAVGKRNAAIVIIAFYLCAALVIYWVFFKDEYKYTSVSPCGDLKVEVYREQKLFSMPGDGGTSGAIVVLKNYWGWTLEKKDDLFYHDVDIVWDFEGGKIDYGEVRSFDFDLTKRGCGKH
ncbi:MAG: hypothetical protein LBS73_05320 [Campylobacteraceae bacterium]|jgi:hypothetical protein|nr:hypothetical protein [Campylobacteraceae bacterium]